MPASLSLDCETMYWSSTILSRTYVRLARSLESPGVACSLSTSAAAAWSPHASVGGGAASIGSLSPMPVFHLQATRSLRRASGRRWDRRSRLCVIVSYDRASRAAAFNVRCCRCSCVFICDMRRASSARATGSVPGIGVVR